jgi:CPA2 family monovalent cation:H+ antiporter-2
MTDVLAGALWLASAGAQTAADDDATNVRDVLVILATAAAVAIVMQRMRLAVIPAYLIAGIIVGPRSLGLVQSTATLSAISQLAIVLLMFGIGLHLHVSALGRSLPRMILIGAVSTILTALALWPGLMVFDLPSHEALTIGMALSMSSTAVVLRLIADRGELKHTSGRLALAILVVQDMLVIAMLAALPALARWAGSTAAAAAATSEPDALARFEADLQPWQKFLSEAALRIGGIAALVVLGRTILPRILREAARERSGEVMMIASIAVAIGAGVATQMLGFGIELGAFLAGFLLAATPFRHHISGQIAPLRDLFMAVFFTVLGMQLDPRIVADNWTIIIVGGMLVTIVKCIVIGGTSFAFGATPAMSIAVGMALAQGGEFSLVFVNVAEEKGVLEASTAANTIAIIVISLILTPALVDLGRRWSIRWQGARTAPWIGRAIGAGETPPVRARGGPFVILGGFGQVGRAVGTALDLADIDYAVVELNPSCFRDKDGQRQQQFIYGDVSNAEVLLSAGIEQTQALVLTMPDEQTVLNACAIARRLQPNIFIAARINFAGHQRLARDLGADLVVVEELETANAMKQAVLKRLTESKVPAASLK